MQQKLDEHRSICYKPDTNVEVNYLSVDEMMNEENVQLNQEVPDSTNGSIDTNSELTKNLEQAKVKRPTISADDAAKYGYEMFYFTTATRGKRRGLKCIFCTKELRNCNQKIIKTHRFSQCNAYVIISHFRNKCSFFSEIGVDRLKCINSVLFVI